MTIRQQGGVFGRNPSFNNMFATTASVDALTVNGSTSLRSNATISSLSGGTRLTIENPAANASNADIRFLASGTGDGIIGFNRSASSLFFNTGGSESARITFGGDLNLLKGNLVVTNGKGIDFSATSGTGTSELFDDYEEGDWLPTFVPATGAFDTITINRSGRYTKIGDTVFVTGEISTSGTLTIGTASGLLSIGGLPFSVNFIAIGNIWTDSNTGVYGPPLDLPTKTRAINSVLEIYKDGSTNNTAFTVADLNSGGGNANRFRFSAAYRTA